MADRGPAQPQLGNYRLVAKLGEGGFAIVYLGEHIYLQKKAAIKVLHVEPSQLTSTVLDGFLTEARTIANLEHPHIIRVLEFGVEKKIPYLVMEHAPNGSLQAHYPKGTPLAFSTIRDYVKQVASALQYAHDKKIVHCDLKPENMLLGKNNEVLLSDFGIAVVIHNTMKTGEAFGTAHYMAPEQYAGKPCPASDQYSLGIVVYRWLSGYFPFNGRNLLEMWRLHKEAIPPSLHKIVSEVSPEVEQVVMKALAKEAQQRFSSIQAFATALEEALQVKHQRSVPPHTLDNELPTFYLPSVTSLLPKASDVQLPKQDQPVKQDQPSSRNQPNKQDQPVKQDQPSNRNQPNKEEELVLPIALLPPEPRALPIRISDVESEQPTDLPGLPSHPRHPGQPGDAVIYQGHTSWVSAVAWAPNGQHIASGSWDKTVQVWDAMTLQTTFTFTGHTHTVKAVAWSPDGAYIASGSWDNTVHIWHAATGDELPSYDGHSAQVEDVSWSPDGKYIASASHDSTVQVWKSSNRRLIYTYRGHTETVWSVTWSPDGQRIASASHDGTIQIWNATTGQHFLTYEGHSEQLASVAWSPQGKYIASAGHDGIIHVWDVTTGSTLFSYSHEKGVVKALQWSPNGRYIASAVKVVDLWDTQAPPRATARNPVFTYGGHSAWVNALTWSPDGKSIASASDDQTVQIWRPSL